MQSLQRRVILGGVVWAVIAILVGGFALLSVFDQIANRRFNALLEERHTQIVVALANSEIPDQIGAFLNDPAYQRPYSGRYWQLNGPAGEVVASRSLFDTVLPLAEALAPEPQIWTSDGPDGPVRGLRQTITLDDGSRWVVSVAAGVSALQAEREEMRMSVAIAFGFVGVLGIGAAALLTSLILKPLRKLSDDVVHRWDSGKPLDVGEYPSEVAPLVGDINQLIDRNREVIAQGRRQAADLAHALKTPSAALRNELVSISRKADGTAPLFDALDRIDAQIIRSLARMRAANASKVVNLRTDLGNSISRLRRLFGALPDTAQTSIMAKTPVELEVAADAQDVEELLGNVIENAVKWCDAQVVISTEAAGDMAVVQIEDDGPGIDPHYRETALTAGTRLDTAVPGTGLGLSISSDLARAYGGSLDLGASERLGGLAVSIRLPLAAAGVSGRASDPHTGLPKTA